MNCSKKITVKPIDDSNTVMIRDIHHKKCNKKDVTTCDNYNNDREEVENDEEEYVRRDPVRKFQFDHNVSTCLTNKFPDMLVNEEGEDIQENCEFSFAPGKGKVPSNIFLDKDLDIKAWPALYPDRRYALNHERKINLTDQKYFTQRIRNK